MSLQTSMISGTRRGQSSIVGKEAKKWVEIGEALSIYPRQHGSAAVLVQLRHGYRWRLLASHTVMALSRARGTTKYAAEYNCLLHHGTYYTWEGVA